MAEGQTSDARRASRWPTRVRSATSRERDYRVEDGGLHHGPSVAVLPHPTYIGEKRLSGVAPSLHVRPYPSLSLFKTWVEVRIEVRRTVGQLNARQVATAK